MRRWYDKGMDFAKLLFFLIPTCLLAQSPAAAPAPPAAKAPTQDFDKVILTIGDVKLTVGDFEQLVDTLPDQYRAAARGAGKRQLAEQLVQLRVLSQEARRRKLDQTPMFKKQ